jgi:hypothetical protein
LSSWAGFNKDGQLSSTGRVPAANDARAEANQNALGGYYEIRDVIFTHAAVLLRQKIYGRSRSWLVTAGRGVFDAEERTDYGDFSFQFNYAVPLESSKKIRFPIRGGIAVEEFEAAMQLNYEINGGEYIFAFS